MNPDDATELEQLVSGSILPVKCNHAGCTRRFKNEHSMRVHKARTHGKGWDTSHNFRNKGKGKKRRSPSDSAAYKHSQYRKQVARYRALGLNAQGKPYANGRNPRGNELAQSKPDSIGEAANAIIVAARVIRSVSLGLKL